MWPPCNANQLTCSDPYAVCVCPWPPLHSNANPLVCLTFQWCSGHLNSILCRCSKQWGPCQGESQQQQRRQNKRWRAHLASNKNLFRKTWNTSVASSSPTFPSLAPASLTPRGEGVSDLRPGWDAVSMQTAHQGEWQVLGREHEIHFGVWRWKDAYRVFQLDFFSWLELPGYDQQEALKQLLLFVDVKSPWVNKITAGMMSYFLLYTTSRWIKSLAFCVGGGDIFF